MTAFEYPVLVRGRAGAGMIHTIAMRVGSPKPLAFGTKRCGAAGIESTREGDRLGFEDPEGLGLELTAQPTTDKPLVAEHPEIPAEFALQGFAGVRAYSNQPEASHNLLTDTLGFTSTDATSYESRGTGRGSYYIYDKAPAARGLGRPGTPHPLPGSFTTAAPPN